MNTRYEKYLSELSCKQRSMVKEALNEYLKGESENIEKLGASEDIYRKCKYLSLESEEKVVIVLMKSNFRYIDIVQVSSGGLNTSMVDIRVLLREALLKDATVLALVHNHPSGSVIPSKEDDKLTKEVKEGCEAIKIRMIDHVIIGNGDYYSYVENGKL